MSKRKGRTWRRKRCKLKHQGQFCNTTCIALQLWMKQRWSFKADGLAVSHFRATGRGIRAKKTINCGDVIISVPKEAMIGVAKACHNSLLVQDILALGCTDSKASIDGVDVLCLFLIEQRMAHATSSWEPYISSLPMSFSHPLYWSHATLNLLPSTFIRAASEYQAKVTRHLSSTNRLLRNISRGRFAGGITWEEYIWAWCCVNTRCVYSDHETHKIMGLQSTPADRYFLVPFLDLLNHSPDVAVKAEMNSKSTHFEIIALNKTKKYDQLFINYGAHSNAKLLLEYGFVASSVPNAHDMVEVDWSQLRSVLRLDEKASNQLLDAARRHKLHLDWSFGHSGPSWGLVSTILTAALASNGASKPAATIDSLCAKVMYGAHDLTSSKQAKIAGRQVLIDLCSILLEHANSMKSRCQSFIDKASCPTDEQHAGMALQLWSIYACILNCNVVYIERNDCFEYFV